MKVKIMVRTNKTIELAELPEESKPEQEVRTRLGQVSRIQSQYKDYMWKTDCNLRGIYR